MRLHKANGRRTMAVSRPGTPFAPAGGSAFSEDARAVIYRPAPLVVSAGRGAMGRVMKFEPRTKPFIEPLMGWIGGTDPLAHVRLRFPNQASAIASLSGKVYAMRFANGCAFFATAKGCEDKRDDRFRAPLSLWDRLRSSV
jgi:hypothetical protein